MPTMRSTAPRFSIVRGDGLERLRVEGAEALVEEDRLEPGRPARRRRRPARRRAPSARASDAWKVSPPESVRTDRRSSPCPWSTTSRSRAPSVNANENRPPDSSRNRADAPSTRRASASATSHCSKCRASSRPASVAATAASSCCAPIAASSRSRSARSAAIARRPVARPAGFDPGRGHERVDGDVAVDRELERGRLLGQRRQVGLHLGAGRRRGRRGRGRGRVAVLGRGVRRPTSTSAAPVGVERLGLGRRREPDGRSSASRAAR